MKSRKNWLLALAFLTLVSCSKSKDDEPVDPGPPVTQNDVTAVDDAVATFLTTYNVPGASLAVAKDGKLVYIKGYGKADKEAGTDVTPAFRFRLASVSKTFTGAAMMLLIQQGRLSLTTKVFGADGVLGTVYGTAPYNANVSAMTVRDLLQNTTGSWGANTGGDVIDQNPSYTNVQLMNWVLNTRTNPRTPGTFYDYSNVGFWIAGRVIEKISGKSYIDFIKQDLMTPVGATQVDIAGQTLADRKANEVKYYGQGTDASYTYNIAFPRRDADGGLIATASDLLRLITAIDGMSNRPDILNATSLSAMNTPYVAGSTYACGVALWSAQDLIFNYGSLPGTRTGFMKHNSNGISVALLLNSRVNPSSETAFVQGMQNLMLNVLKNHTASWQTNLDQF